MATPIKPKRSAVASAVPTTANLADGEFAINTTDKKIFMRVGAAVVEVANAATSFAASAVTSGTFADARIAASNVTQHNAVIAPTWANVSGKPTTMAGYGLSDATPNNVWLQAQGVERVMGWNMTGRNVYLFGNTSFGVGLYDTVGGMRFLSESNNDFTAAGRVKTNAAHFNSTTNAAVLGCTAGGTVYIRPDGVDNTDNQLLVTTTNISWDGNNIMHAGRNDYCRASDNLYNNFNSYTGTSDLTTIDGASNGPFGGMWYNLVNIRHRGGAADGNVWGGQITFGMTGASTRLAFRSQVSGAWEGWTEVATVDGTRAVNCYVGNSGTQAATQNHGWNNNIPRAKTVIEADGSFSIWGYNASGASAVRAINLMTTSSGGTTRMTVSEIRAQDVYCDRGDNTGVLYLNGSGTKYVYFDGSNYQMPGGSLLVNSIEVGFRKVPLTAQNANYTLVAGDSGKGIVHNDTTARTYTVNPSVFAAGDVVTIANDTGTGAVTIAQGASMNLYLAGTATTGNRTLAVRGVATILFTAADRAYVSGAGVT